MFLRLSALLEKLLKREKKTRRLLQRRLSSVGVSNHGDGSDGGYRRAARATSPDGDDKLRVSSADDVPVSAYQTTGLS